MEKKTILAGESPIPLTSLVQSIGWSGLSGSLHVAANGDQERLSFRFWEGSLAVDLPYEVLLSRLVSLLDAAHIAFVFRSGGEAVAPATKIPVEAILLDAHRVLDEVAA